MLEIKKDKADKYDMDAIRIARICRAIARGIIDLLFSLGFLALAYSFGLKRLEFQSKYNVKSKKNMDRLLGESISDHKKMRTLSVFKLFNKSYGSQTLASKISNEVVVGSDESQSLSKSSFSSLGRTEDSDLSAKHKIITEKNNLLRRKDN